MNRQDQMNQLLIQSLVIGVFATIFMDICGVIRNKLFQTQSLNYAFVGRWVLGWAKGQFHHVNISQASTQSGEQWVGWAFHYLTGILWVGILFGLSYLDLYPLNFVSIMLFALFTTLVPFLIMQPALGLGFFASRTPVPFDAVKKSIITHLCFGFGIYLGYFIFGYFG